MSNNKKLFTIIIIFLTALSLIAQEKKESSASSKLKEIKGKVQKIVISSDDKQIVIEGDEAQKLVDKMKSALDQKDKLIWLKEDGGKASSANKRMKFFISEDDAKTDSLIKKNVNVEKVDGNLIVTVETQEGDESNVEVYEGKDAEKFLAEKKEGGKFNVVLKKLGDKKRGLWVISEGKGENKDDSKSKIEKKITVENTDGKMKVKVETTENGETKIDEYTGEEAEKFLQENKEGKKFHFYLDGDHKGNAVFMMNESGDCDSTKCCKKMKVGIEKKGDKENPEKVIIIKKKDKKDED